MERMEEADLYEIAIVQSKPEFEANSGSGPIEISLIVNAHAAAFYSGARYVETPRRARDWLPAWLPGLGEKKQRPVPLGAYGSLLAQQMADQYIKRLFLGYRPEDERLIRRSVARGFRRGAAFMWERIRSA